MLHHRPTIVASTLKIGLSLSFILVSVAANAQGLYRCGNTYQDKPCTGQAGKKLSAGIASNTKSSEPVKAVDSQCVQRGDDAKKIVWAREGGLGELQMLEKAKSEDERKLVSDVYRLRGSAGEIKHAIEAACMADKAGTTNPASAMASATASDKDAKNSKDNPSGKATVETANTEEKKRNCDKLRAQLEAAITAKKTTPSISIDLPKQRKENEAALAKLGC